MKAIPDADRDMSHQYMVKEEGISDLNVFGGQSIKMPVYCLSCPVTKRDEQLDVIQMADHLELVHIPRGHAVFMRGLERLKHNAERLMRSRRRREAER